MGANRALFDIQKEYNINELPFNKRYTHPAIIWYIKMHKARMDGTIDEFKLQKPVKNMKERSERVKQSLGNAKDKAMPTMIKIAGKIQNAREGIKTKAGEIKDKVKNRKNKDAIAEGSKSKDEEENALEEDKQD